MWFLFAIVSVLAWGTADLFYKIGNNEKDPNKKSVANNINNIGYR